MFNPSPPSIYRCKAEPHLGKNDIPKGRELSETGAPTSILTDNTHSLRANVITDLPYLAF